MRRLVFLAVVLFAAPSLGQYYPCSPVFLANPQGRPLAHTTIDITNLDGSMLVTPAATNAAGTVQFNNTMPANQILQVYINPAGRYLVHVSGEGITKNYETICGDGVSSSVRRISISRSAELMLNTTPNAPVLTCPTTGAPCLQAFADDVDSTVTFDWVAPSFPVEFESLLLTWQASDIVDGVAVWRLDWCTYSEGDLNCAPSGANAVDVTSTATSGHRRIDMLVAPTQWPLAWNPNEHVVVAITRHGTDTRDTLAGVALENVRMEMLR